MLRFKYQLIVSCFTNFLLGWQMYVFQNKIYNTMKKNLLPILLLNDEGRFTYN
jgi:hypothetical protein